MSHSRGALHAWGPVNNRKKTGAGPTASGVNSRRKARISGRSKVRAGTPAQVSSLRKTGIGLVGDTPWGTHICVFYETKQDLLDAAVHYFEAGLHSNEFCVWAISDPITEREAMDALACAIPDFATSQSCSIRISCARRTCRCRNGWSGTAKLMCRSRRVDRAEAAGAPISKGSPTESCPGRTRDAFGGCVRVP